MPVTAFLSYSHKDESYRETLETHLAALRRQGRLDAWHDRKLLPGDAFDDVIAAEVERADLVILLVSPDFIASDYCVEKELARALERHAQNQCVVVPVIVRPCDWHEMPFGRLTALPTDGQPIATAENEDAAFLDVVKGLKLLIGHVAGSAKN